MQTNSIEFIVSLNKERAHKHTHARTDTHKHLRPHLGEGIDQVAQSLDIISTVVVVVVVMMMMAICHIHMAKNFSGTKAKAGSEMVTGQSDTHMHG
jgi:hypothetical protein